MSNWSEPSNIDDKPILSTGGQTPRLKHKPSLKSNLKSVRNRVLTEKQQKIAKLFGELRCNRNEFERIMRDLTDLIT